MCWEKMFTTTNLILGIEKQQRALAALGACSASPRGLNLCCSNDSLAALPGGCSV